MEKVQGPSGLGEALMAAGSPLQRQQAVVLSSEDDEDQVGTSQDMDQPMEVLPECLDGLEHTWVCFNCGTDLPDDIPMGSEFNNVVNPFVKGSSSSGVSQNLWIPLVGRHVAGNYQITS